jgi:hypothetical protein
VGLSQVVEIDVEASQSKESALFDIAYCNWRNQLQSKNQNLTLASRHTTPIIASGTLNPESITCSLLLEVTITSPNIGA